MVDRWPLALGSAWQAPVGPRASHSEPSTPGFQSRPGRMFTALGTYPVGDRGAWRWGPPAGVCPRELRHRQVAGTGTGHEGLLAVPLLREFGRDRPPSRSEPGFPKPHPTVSEPSLDAPCVAQAGDAVLPAADQWPRRDASFPVARNAGWGPGSRWCLVWAQVANPFLQNHVRQKAISTAVRRWLIVSF